MRVSEDSASYTYSTAKTVIEIPYPAAGLPEEHDLRERGNSRRPQHGGQCAYDEPFRGHRRLLEFRKAAQSLDGHHIGDGHRLSGQDGKADRQPFKHADDGSA